MATVKKSNDSVSVLQMKDGDIALITEWSTYDDIITSRYEGRIVQRYGNSLISIGMNKGCVWSGIWEEPISQMKGCYVKILGEGTEIVL